jgi:hypothetical protein
MILTAIPAENMETDLASQLALFRPGLQGGLPLLPKNRPRGRRIKLIHRQ